MTIPRTYHRSTSASVQRTVAVTPSVRGCPTVWDPVSRVVSTDGGRVAAWVADSAAVSVDDSVVVWVDGWDWSSVPGSVPVWELPLVPVLVPVLVLSLVPVSVRVWVVTLLVRDWLVYNSSIFVLSTIPTNKDEFGDDGEE